MVLGEVIGLNAGANVRGFGTREKGFSEISLNVKFIATNGLVRLQ